MVKFSDFALQLLLLTLLLAGCGKQQTLETATAKLINGLATRDTYGVPESGPPDFPTTITCGTSTFTRSTNSSYRRSMGGGSTSGGSSAISFSITASFTGDGLVAPAGGDASIDCTIQKVRYAYDTSTSKLTGAGTIESCDGFDCTVNGSTKLDCAAMTQALSSNPCK